MSSSGPHASLWQLVESRVAASANGLCCTDERGRRFTFGDLHAESLRVAGGLSAQGIGPGSVVSWQLPTWWEALALTCALSRLGAVQNPLIPILGTREVSFICAQARTELLVVPGLWRGTDYPALAADVRHDNPSLQVLVADRELPHGDPSALSQHPVAVGANWLFYTSGTTSEPKGARHTDATLVAAAAGFSASLGLDHNDVLSFVIPLTHIGGVIHLLASLMHGCGLALAEVFDAEATTAQLREQGVTIVPGSLPFMHGFFAFQDRHPDLDPLFPKGRIAIHGGSPKPPGLYPEAKRRLGFGVISGYGMTECPMLAWSTPQDADDDAATTEGRAVDGVDIRILRADGTDAGTGEEGEVCVRGPQLMLGYVDASLDTAGFDPEHYFRSGDLGSLSPTGHLRITGRVKDIIIRNMENISARELEDLLYDHPHVEDVAVIGVPDERTGERACAVVVPVAGGPVPSLQTLCEHLLAAGLSKRKLPEQLVVVGELPRNAMNKVLKAQLQRQIAG